MNEEPKSDLSVEVASPIDAKDLSSPPTSDQICKHVASVRTPPLRTPIIFDVPVTTGNLREGVALMELV
ncbi:hypothetical protein M407DRAFT_35157 [Tulasnella calospora MUT 4182]|uniref:Uncharacterized protein n=1 Tax=Tulasnella calospora MUT 4182 TaxID=1051891 RepID=A0A0C3L0K9_9AGAM|nr:hypothetical protein M407DRAFT_35157 [Tulasnella calospora MUT 4182]